MGSLFMVIVPTREFEIKLRQKEYNIVKLSDSDSGSALAGPLTTRQFGSTHSIHLPEEHTNSLLSTAETGATGSGTGGSGSDIAGRDVFSALVNGERAEVVITSDSITVVRRAASLDKFDEPVANSSPGSKKKYHSVGEAALQKTVDSMFLEKLLEDHLERYKIMTACWGMSVDGNYSQVTFMVGADLVEEIINSLQTVGIGVKFSSTFCVCPASVYYDADEAKRRKLKDMGDPFDTDDQNKMTKWNDFKASIKSRLTVAQVVSTVKANAIMTFDYIVLILVAGMIAGLGLVDDSAVNVVASMLVSPLMGPIMATTFGAMIRDKQLIKIGLANELIGLAICLCMGYTMGILLQVEVWPGPWDDVKTWPTEQMQSRSESRSLAVGVLVAIPSGAGVALSILAGNSGSLVGVAISASLLPPAVNCGILWGLATVIAIKVKSHGGDVNVGCHTPLQYKHNFTRNFETIHCENVVNEYFRMGCISLCLTLINIVVIFFIGIIVLKIKEVAPHTTRSSLKRFFKEDIKAARQANIEGRNVYNEVGDSENADEIYREMEDDQVFNQVHRRAPFGSSAGGSIMNEIKKRKKDKDAIPPSIKPSVVASSQQVSQGWGGWFGGFFGRSGGEGGASTVAKSTSSAEHHPSEKKSGVASMQKRV